MVRYTRTEHLIPSKWSNKWRCSQHTSAKLTNSYPLRPRRVTWIQTIREGVYVKSGRSGALTPGKLILAWAAEPMNDTYSRNVKPAQPDPCERQRFHGPFALGIIHKRPTNGNRGWVSYLNGERTQRYRWALSKLILHEIKPQIHSSPSQDLNSQYHCSKVTV